MQIKKRVSIFFLIFFLLAIILVAAEGESDIDDIQDTADEYVPINEDGDFDPSKYKSKAEERIEKINEYIGPITNFLWGVELSLSWIFLFSFVVWILLIEIIVTPASEIFNFNVLGSLFVAFIIATLAMQGFGKDFVVWMDSIATRWWVGLIVFLFAVIFGTIYSIIITKFGRKMKADKEKEQKERDLAKIHADAKISEERMKNN